MTWPGSVLHSVRGTPQAFAAAVMSMTRAFAPASRSGFQAACTLELPPVPWMPKSGLTYSFPAAHDQLNPPVPSDADPRVRLKRSDRGLRRGAAAAGEVDGQGEARTRDRAGSQEAPATQGTR